MISDVLFEAVTQIDEYLDDPTFDTTYGGDLRAEVIAVRNLMDGLREKLDAPPALSLARVAWVQCSRD